MSGVEEFADRVYASLMGGILAVIVTAAGSIWRVIETPEAASPELSLLVIKGLILSMPGIVTVLGIGIAAYRAGPFGFFGAVIEVGGVNRLFDPASTGGIGLVFVGALLVVIGSFFPWKDIYREILT